MASKERILARAREIMDKRSDIDAEEAWMLAVAQLTIEDEEKAKADAEKEKELDNLIKKGSKVVNDLEGLHKRLEDDAQ